jgi:hypothetical protein
MTPFIHESNDPIHSLMTPFTTYPGFQGKSIL